MERRELLKMIAVLTGAAFIGGETLLSGCNTPDAKAAGALDWSDKSMQFLDEVGETILPAGKIPGAKAAEVSKVMKSIVTDCYQPDEQQAFSQTEKNINDASQKKFSKSFLETTPAQREELLKEIDKEAKAYEQSRKQENPHHYFTMVKQLTMLGYFTSKIGSTQALRYNPVPHKYEGCVPYTKGDKAWAPTPY